MNELLGHFNLKKPQNGSDYLPAQLAITPTLRPFVLVDTPIIRLYSDDGYCHLS
ncbi:MAG: hypothetical protein UW99_C0051G0008 [Candidatus Collierbacteria bacterium GW2011_GWC2_45_15]|uniref:Uncharacterized protein n=1 Tax=Candidatus Collierbacteria bacterium GW2011_GWC2_45_15 TaxID=1618394 RepID=A0A0G1LLC2_9BACT|nr:MAG: hypothetical protein UW99_C0051G0008 [Candidatus Collierbacteria bacterium GW2011_GWC2_45_15]